MTRHSHAPEPPPSRLRLAMTALLMTGAVALPVALHGHAMNTRPDVGQAAMRVQVDPATGALVPAVAPLIDSNGLNSEAAYSHSGVGLRVELRADGSRLVNLQGRFMETVIATTDPAGQTRLGCLHNDSARQRVLEPTASPAGVAVEQ